MEKPELPIIIEGSPIEFALMGPLGRHRGVLVKSKNASLDLIGYDNPHVDLFLGRDSSRHISRNSLLSVLFILLKRSTVYVARSHGAVLADANMRKTYYNLVWRGMCEGKDFANFQLAFQGTVADLNEALESDDRSQIEWTISGLITACSIMQKRVQRRKSNFLIFSISYIVFILVIVIISAVKL